MSFASGTGVSALVKSKQLPQRLKPNHNGIALAARLKPMPFPKNSFAGGVDEGYIVIRQCGFDSRRGFAASSNWTGHRIKNTVIALFPGDPLCHCHPPARRVDVNVTLKDT